MTYFEVFKDSTNDRYYFYFDDPDLGLRTMAIRSEHLSKETIDAIVDRVYIVDLRKTDMEDHDYTEEHDELVASGER